MNYEVNMGFPCWGVTQFEIGRKQSEWPISRVAYEPPALLCHSVQSLLSAHQTLTSKKFLWQTRDNHRGRWAKSETSGRGRERYLQTILTLSCRSGGFTVCELAQLSNWGSTGHFYTACCPWLATSHRLVLLLLKYFAIAKGPHFCTGIMNIKSCYQRSSAKVCSTGRSEL